MKLFSYFCTTESGDDYFGTCSSEKKPSDEQLKKALVPSLGADTVEDIWRCKIWECESAFTISMDSGVDKKGKKAKRTSAKAPKVSKKEGPLYISFSESHFAERETCTYLIPVEGNESDIAKVRALIALHSQWPTSYEFNPELLTAAEVKKLNGTSEVDKDTKYLNQYLVATGFKKLPKSVDWQKSDPFYAGAIIKL